MTDLPVSPYLAQPLRSLQQACTETTRRRRQHRPCAECDLVLLCSGSLLRDLAQSVTVAVTVTVAVAAEAPH